MSSFVNISIARAEARTRKGGMGRVTCYALWDLKDGGVRYVGVTDKLLASRLQRHLLQPTNRAMAKWFRDVVERGSEVMIEPLQRCRKGPLHWEQVERAWIGWFRGRGDLLNVDEGGRCRRGRDEWFPAKYRSLLDGGKTGGQ